MRPWTAGSVPVRSRCPDALAILELTARLGRTRPRGFGIGSVGEGSSVGPEKTRYDSSNYCNEIKQLAVLKIRVSMVRFRPWPPLPTR